MAKSMLLSTESPRLYKAFARIFTSEDLEMAQEVYALVVAHGGNQEDYLHRETGVTFNPRVSRVCEILIKECAQKTFRIFAAAMASCAKGISAELDCVDMKLVHEARAWDTKDGASQLSPEAEMIALAIKLDELRHLHMTTLDDTAKQAVYQDVTQRLLHCISHDKSVRLKELINAWADRFKRSLTIA